MRNLDYHGNDHPPYEGRAVKQKLLGMIRNAKDLYNNLQDTDDLPEWISSEISKAGYITSKTKDYIISKLEKKCLDGNLTESELKLIINKHILSENINENLYSKIKKFIKPKKKKTSFSSNLYKKEFSKSLDSNHILSFLKIIKQLTYNIDFAIKNFRYNEQNRNAFFSVNEESLKEILMFLNSIIVLINSKDLVKTTSAKKRKKKSLSNLYGLLENETKKLFTKSLSEINRCILLFDLHHINHDYFKKSYDARLAYAEDLLEKFKKEEVVKEIKTMIKQIQDFEKLIEQIKTMEK